MRPPVLFPLFASVNSLKGIGAKTAGFISRLCGDRVVDLIWHLPAALIDRTYAPKLINARPNVICTLKVRVIEHIPPQTRKQPYKVRCSDGTDDVTLIFCRQAQKESSAASWKVLTANGR